ncbi:MAG: hypothetical protein WD847_14175 [Pirellulales bacterium]
MKNRCKLVLALVALGLVSFSQDEHGQSKKMDKPKDELALLQGRWSMTTRFPDGKPMRIEKEVKDWHETVTVFDPDEKVRYAFEGGFKLDKVGRARVFTWTNRVMTVGPRKGRKVPDGGYVYTVRDGRWVCALGMLEDDPLPMQLQVFEPAKDKSI